MLVFENSGEIDPRLITLMGVNVKTSTSPIGFFGTGLKYAIACMARWDETIIIQSGAAEFTFRVEPTQIRGKDFSLIHMHGKHDSVQLGFTTELGKNWQPWQVYRELYCNAKDEAEYSIYETNAVPPPRPGYTRCIVDGPNILKAYSSRAATILLRDDAPIFENSRIQIFVGSAKSAFYRGVAVFNFPSISLYTYNILGNIGLSEDRTADWWELNYELSLGLTSCEDPEVIERTLLADKSILESNINYYHHDGNAIWEEIASRLANEQRKNIPVSVAEKFPLSKEKAAARERKRCETCGQEIPDKE
jgi:hypothetical protein